MNTPNANLEDESLEILCSFLVIHVLHVWMNVFNQARQILCKLSCVFIRVISHRFSHVDLLKLYGKAVFQIPQIKNNASLLQNIFWPRKNTWKSAKHVVIRLVDSFEIGPSYIRPVDATKTWFNVLLLLQLLFVRSSKPIWLQRLRLL